VTNQIRAVAAEIDNEEENLLRERNQWMARESDRTKLILIFGALVCLTLQVIAFEMLKHEVEERRKAEGEIQGLNEKLEKQVAQLEVLNKELESFSYTVSHDLRAPVRHIGGFAELLQKSSRDRLDETGKRHLNTIAQAAKRMGQLIDDLLSFSRMGRAEMLKSPISLGAMVEEIIGDLMPQTEGRDVQWKVAPLPKVQGDPAMLHVVFVNLLSNALKYSRGRTPAVIEVGVSGAAGGQKGVFVRDNGTGFDMKYVDKLFGVFQRLHSSDEFEGTGIGLATVQRIIQRHGGRVWAEGTVGQGATFYITLPIQRTEGSLG